MLTVRDFWTRIAIGAVMMLLGLLALTGGDVIVLRVLGVALLFAGLGNIVWVVISASLIVRKAKRIERDRR